MPQGAPPWYICKRARVKLSVITPLSASGNPYIGAAYDSLKAQTVQDFDWVILANHGGKVPWRVRWDQRVRVVHEEHEGIGALKRRACELARGDVIVELDHDDWLWPNALDRVRDAVVAGAEFIYSDFAEVLDGSMTPNTPYRADCGWATYDVTWQGHPLLAHHSPPVTPQNLRFVDWSPNHLRAWTREAYADVGGHDPTFAVGDDHDLVVRMYLAGKRFAHVPECLYGYRVHAANNVRTQNAAIREATNRVYNKSIWALAERFTDDGSLAKVDLCGGMDCPPGYTPLDVMLGQDLNYSWPLADNSVGVLRAHDALEHLLDPVHSLNEAFRVLAPGGFLMISVPSTDGRGAFQDPTHRSLWNSNSIWYFSNKNFARYVPEFKGRFAVSRTITWHPSDFHREHLIPYVESHLIALKPPYQHMGEVLI